MPFTGEVLEAWKAIAEKLADHLEHSSDCIRSFQEAGEPTPDGGYRTKYKGKWYDSRPVNKEPKCDCGADEIFAEYRKLAGI